MDERTLLARLQHLLEGAHARFGQSIEPINEHTVPADFEVHPVGPSGVLAFLGDYVLAAWPDEEQRPAARDAYNLLWQRLRERGLTRHMVHPLNFRSVKLTRRLGAKPKGVDADGYVHYELTLEAFESHVPRSRHHVEGLPHGQEVAAAEGT